MEGGGERSGGEKVPDVDEQPERFRIAGPSRTPQATFCLQQRVVRSRPHGRPVAVPVLILSTRLLEAQAWLEGY